MTDSATAQTTHAGLHAGRLSREPLEARFAAEWASLNTERYPILPRILATGDPRIEPTMADLSDRDIAVAATVIQWLGSPVGMDFVRTCLEFDACSECGAWPLRADEDGCCISCGADAESVTGYEIRERIRSRREP